MDKIMKLIKMIILKIRQSYDPIYREQDEQ